MKLHVIFGQRRCSYDGEFAPEALDIMDERGMEENPEWFEQALAGHMNDGNFTSVVPIVIDVPDSEIERRLNPKVEPVKGTVVDGDKDKP